MRRASVKSMRGETMDAKKTKKPKSVRTTDKQAGAVALDLKTLFDFVHEAGRPDLVTGTLLVHMETLLQQHDRHRVELEAKGAPAAPILWTPPELPPAPAAAPLPTPAPALSVDDVIRAVDGTVLLL